MNENKEKKSFVFYFEWLEAMSPLSDGEKVQFIYRIGNYARYGKEEKLSGLEAAVWIPIKNRLDQDRSKYEQTCKKNQQKAIYRWRGDREEKIPEDAAAYHSIPEDAAAYHSIPEDAAAYHSIPEDATDTDNDYGYDNGIDYESVLKVGVGGVGAPAPHQASYKLTRYPKSPEEVLTLAQNINLDMSPEQAEKYYLYRAQRDWEVGTGSGAFKLKVENIPQNMRLWVNQDKADAAREEAAAQKEDEEKYAGIIGGKYTPRH